MVQQISVGLCRAQRRRGRTDCIAADEAVDALELPVFAQIHHSTPLLRQRHRGAFVRGAAQRGALDGRVRGVRRVDLDDPAKAVGLVRVAHGVEALIQFRPAVPGGAADVPALFVRGGHVGSREVVAPVFFARQEGAPGRAAGRAVAQRAQHAAAAGVGGGAHHRVARRRAADGARCVGSDAACIGRWAHQLPAGAFKFALKFALEFDLDHGHAVRGLRLLHLVQRPAVLAVGVQQAVVGVFVVDGQEAAP